MNDLWLPSFNLYREIDLGVQQVMTQWIRTKIVCDTAGLSFFVVGSEFRLP